MARRGQKAKEHPLVAGMGPSPTMVSYGAEIDSGAGFQDESIGAMAAPARRAPPTAPSRPRPVPGGAAAAAARSNSDGRLAGAAVRRNSKPQPNVSATSNAARSKIGEPPAVSMANRGKVPAYIKQRKQELGAVKAAEDAEKNRERVPAGLRRVNANEQEESLLILNERKTASEAKYSRLPLRCNTQRARLAKEALEEKIQAHEALIKAYSKPKVYVSAETMPIQRGDNDDADDPPSPEQERQAYDRPGGGMPWSGAGQAAPTKTHTMILQPPGGKSSFQLGW